MCKNRKTAIAIALLLIMSFTACGTSKSAAANTSGEVPKEEYLNVSALNQQSGQSGTGQYQVYTLEKGTYVEAAMSQTLERAYINATIAYIELPCAGARFGEYEANYFNYVEKGDVLATFYAEVDTIALEEARLNLQRLEERYAQAELDHIEKAEELRVEQITEPDGNEKLIIGINRTQEDLNWENTKRSYEQKIADAKERIEELEEVGNVIEVYSPATGLVITTRGYATGMEVADGDYLAHIIPVDEYYVSTDKRTDQYGFGMELTFKHRGGEAIGTIVSADSKVLYGNLDAHEVIISVETNETVTQDDLNDTRGLTVDDNLKTVENVVLVPKAAVTVEGDEYFVTVLKEDGSLLKTEFIAGGGNTDYYWVLDGLTEGTQILMK